MATEANKKLAYTICERWSIKKGGDVDHFFELFHDDAVFEIMEGKGSPPYFGGVKTKKEFREFVFGQSRGNDLNVRVVGITADDERLAVEADSDMTINGHTYRNVYHWLFKIRDGKIFQSNLYLDTLLTKTATEWQRDGRAVAASATRRMIHQETDIIEHPVEDVWALVSSFGAIKAWMPAVESCSVDGVGVGAVRTVHTPGNIIKEKLEFFDPTAHTISYRQLDPTGLPMSGGFGTIRLEAKGKTTKITYLVDAEEVDDASKETIQAIFKPFLLASIAGLKEVLGRPAKTLF